MVHLPEFNAGGPHTLIIYEEGKPGGGVVLSGILAGDVWLASGQSNMEWKVQTDDWKGITQNQALM